MSPRTPDQRRDADQRGREGEAEAAMFLAQAGWRIVAERVKTRAGEIDLIARIFPALAEMSKSDTGPALRSE